MKTGAIIPVADGLVCRAGAREAGTDYRLSWVTESLYKARMKEITL